MTVTTAGMLAVNAVARILDALEQCGDFISRGWQ
jgi:hypothetical protein